MARELHVSHGLVGILGVVPTEPEIIGVFPEISATVQPHSQEIRFRRGDSLDIPILIQDDQDPPSGVVIARSVLRWAAKQGFGVTERFGVRVRNEGALIIKRSYDPREIEFTRESNGEAILHIKRADTLELPTVPAVWDLELTRPVDHIDTAGATVNLTAGSDVVFGNAVNWQDLGIGIGDILEVQGLTVVILEVLSQTHLKVDFSLWTAENLVDFNLWTGNVKTVATGPFEAIGDVIV